MFHNIGSGKPKTYVLVATKQSRAKWKHYTRMSWFRTFVKIFSRKFFFRSFLVGIIISWIFIAVRKWTDACGVIDLWTKTSCSVSSRFAPNVHVILGPKPPQNNPLLLPILVRLANNHSSDSALSRNTQKSYPFKSTQSSFRSATKKSSSSMCVL